MKTLIKILFTTLVLFFLSSCSKGPKPIDYGNDGCHFCKMTIVDKIHATELITDKGKIFKFDASECMLNYLNEDKQIAVGLLLTNYYDSPTAFIPSEEATFLISDKIPSPMGANLTAFQTKESAQKVQVEKGGVLYTWSELKSHLKK